jgi:hypothetical protein
MIAALKADPVGWYRANKLNAAKAAGKGTTSRESFEASIKKWAQSIR